MREAKRIWSPGEDFKDVEAALSGACDIVAERVSEDASLRSFARDLMARKGQVQARAVKSKTKDRTAFESYYEHDEPLRRIPSHRYLAIARGVEQGVLRMRVVSDSERVVGRALMRFGHKPRSPWGPLLVRAVEDSYKRLLDPALTRDVLGEVKARAEREAVEVFASNLRDISDGGAYGRSGGAWRRSWFADGLQVRGVVCDGPVLGNSTFYLTSGASKEAQAREVIVGLVKRHKIQAVAVGNGTGGRDAERFVRDSLVAAGLDDVIVVLVPETGASVYSASDVAREEFPDLDLTVRGAISIGRRLQDPLAELVKVEPKAMGVGQYQHDVDQKLLQRKLGEVIESCVNQVGVQLNTASAPLLSYVAGIGPKLAARIVAQRDKAGPYKTRRDVLKVSGLGPRGFEQAAGFLRVRGGKHPLDDSAVHPERIKLVERIAKDQGVALGDLLGKPEKVREITWRHYLSDDVGMPTLQDIAEELGKPGRDPRANFEAPQFREDIRTMDDLVSGMILEGVVTNVTDFGAFVDLGIKQDGLVHISQLADRFVRDPRQEVRVGDRVQVRVMEVDKARKRISLTRKGLSSS